jgi:hypothetical protein
MGFAIDAIGPVPSDSPDAWGCPGPIRTARRASLALAIRKSTRPRTTDRNHNNAQTGEGRPHGVRPLTFRTPSDRRYPMAAQTIDRTPITITSVVDICISLQL